MKKYIQCSCFPTRQKRVFLNPCFCWRNPQVDCAMRWSQETVSLIPFQHSYIIIHGPRLWLEHESPPKFMCGHLFLNPVVSRGGTFRETWISSVWPHKWVNTLWEWVCYKAASVFSMVGRLPPCNSHCQVKKKDHLTRCGP